jgi:hypothetical protein
MRVPTARILNRGVSKKDEWTYLSVLVEDDEVGAQIVESSEQESTDRVSVA